MSRLATVLTLVIVLTVIGPAGAREILVDASATSATPDGETWCSAYLYLQDALAIATAGDVIRVANGVYKPDEGAAQTPGDREATFQLVDAVEMYGGYAGCGAADPDERDITLYESILSGDLNEDDYTGGEASNCCYAHDTPGCDEPACEAAICAADPANSYCCDERWDEFCANEIQFECPGLCDAELSDNSYHVVTGSETTSTSVLDGFTVCAGAGGPGHPTEPGIEVGAGMYNRLGHPSIRNCLFRDNFVHGWGGGMYNYQSSPTIAGCRFVANRTDGGAGMGVMNEGGSSPTLIDCVFHANWSGGISFGGGIANLEGSNPLLLDCLFSRNHAYIGGALISDSDCAPVVIGSRFVGNSAVSGGAVFNVNLSELLLMNCAMWANTAENGGALRNVSAAVYMANCTVSGNVASEQGGGIYNNTSQTSGLAPVTLANTIIWGNSDSSGSGASAQIVDDQAATTAEHSCIQGGWAGTGNIAADPLFMDADGPDGIPGTEDDDLRLRPGSPCIDAGNNDAVPLDEYDLDEDGDTAEPIPFDLAWLARFLDDPGTADTGNAGALGGPIVDMGAYEAFDDCNGNDVPDWTEPDSDGDGLIDGCDACPFDENKIEPGICGCGESDTDDTDGDGVLDCIDICPGADDAVFAPECQAAIPTVSAWGLVVLTLLLMTLSKLAFSTRRSPQPK